MMMEKYIIDKEDLPKLIRGEELPLSQGSKARAFKIEIAGNLTNGDMIKTLFPSEVWLQMKAREFNKTWWNAPYKGGKDE